MKELIQKLPLNDNSSFVCRTYKTPHFETPWHHHIEYELVLITEGNGNILVGDYVGDYEEGDVFFLGSNLPHFVRKKEPDMIGSAIVIQFHQNFMGEKIWHLPEMVPISQLLKTSAKGIQLHGILRKKVKEIIEKMEKTEGYPSIRMLLDCLHLIAHTPKNRRLLTSTPYSPENDSAGVIGQIFDYTFAHFQEEIKVEKVARLVNMSLSTFMRFFKKNTKKTYIQFVKEVRIAHACKLLAKGTQSISFICHDSGYNNWANFCRQFAEIKGMSPSDYRKKRNTSV